MYPSSNSSSLLVLTNRVSFILSPTLAELLKELPVVRKISIRFPRVFNSLYAFYLIKYF